jgi:hypothetical protein
VPFVQFGFQGGDPSRQLLQLFALLVGKLARLDCGQLAGFHACGFRRGERRFPLRHPVVVAPRILVDLPGPLEHQRARHHFVQEFPVVAHQQHRAGVFHQQVFDQLQRLQIEVVRRLVEHQHVRWPRKKLRQQQAAALAPRQHPHRAPRPVGRKEKLLQIADHMPPLAVHHDEFVAGGHVVEHRALLIQRLPQLVEIGDFQLRAMHHAPLVRRLLPQQDADQRGLAAAVRPQDPHLVAAADFGVQAAEQPAPGVGEAEILRRDDLVARAIRLLQRGLDGTAQLPAGGALGAQLQQLAHPPLVARAPRLHALAQPDFLLRELLVEHRVLALLVFQRGCLALQILAVAARPGPQPTPVQLHDPRRHPPQKRPVVRHEQNRPRKPPQEVLQPLNRFHVEVVGGLVQQQHIRR